MPSQRFNDTSSLQSPPSQPTPTTHLHSSSPSYGASSLLSKSPNASPLISSNHINNNNNNNNNNNKMYSLNPHNNGYNNIPPSQYLPSHNHNNVVPPPYDTRNHHPQSHSHINNGPSQHYRTYYQHAAVHGQVHAHNSLPPIAPNGVIYASHDSYRRGIVTPSTSSQHLINNNNNNNIMKSPSDNNNNNNNNTNILPTSHPPHYHRPNYHHSSSLHDGHIIHHQQQNVPNYHVHAHSMYMRPPIQSQIVPQSISSSPSNVHIPTQSNVLNIIYDDYRKLDLLHLNHSSQHLTLYKEHSYRMDDYTYDYDEQTNFLPYKYHEEGECLYSQDRHRVYCTCCLWFEVRHYDSIVKKHQEALFKAKKLKEEAKKQQQVIATTQVQEIHGIAALDQQKHLQNYNELRNLQHRNNVTQVLSPQHQAILITRNNNNNNSNHINTHQHHISSIIPQQTQTGNEQNELMHNNDENHINKEKINNYNHENTNDIIKNTNKNNKSDEKKENSNTYTSINHDNNMLNKDETIIINRLAESNNNNNIQNSKDKEEQETSNNDNNDNNNKNGSNHCIKTNNTNIDDNMAIKNTISNTSTCQGKTPEYMNTTTTTSTLESDSTFASNYHDNCSNKSPKVFENDANNNNNNNNNNNGMISIQQIQELQQRNAHIRKLQMQALLDNHNHSLVNAVAVAVTKNNPNNNLKKNYLFIHIIVQ